MKSNVCTESKRKQITADNEMLVHTTQGFMQLPTCPGAVWAHSISPGINCMIRHMAYGHCWIAEDAGG